MTVEILSMTLCLASGIFGRPAWSPEKCDERAGQLMEIAKRHDLDPLLMVATNIYECDMREDVNVLIYEGEGKQRKVVAVDACPMGVRFKGPDATMPHDPVVLYELAATRMERWKRWCKRSHNRSRAAGSHHFMAHYNQGNPIYASQVLGIWAVIARRPAKEKDVLSFTARTKETVKRLCRVFKIRQS